MEPETTFNFLDSSELTLMAFCNPDVEYHMVPIGELLTLREDWLYVPEGIVDPSLVARMEEHGLDQAPALGSFGIRLVSIETLRSQLRSGEPIGAKTRFVESDCLVMPKDEYRVTASWIIDAMAERAAVIVLNAPGHRISAEERRKHEEDRGRERKGPRIGGGGWARTSLRSDFDVLGLLTRADLNRKAMRRAIYEQIFDLEDGLARLVARYHPIASDWIRLLPQSAQDSFFDRRGDDRGHHVQSDPIWQTSLSHLLGVSVRTPALVQVPGGTRERNEVHSKDKR